MSEPRRAWKRKSKKAVSLPSGSVTVLPISARAAAADAICAVTFTPDATTTADGRTLTDSCPPPALSTWTAKKPLPLLLTTPIRPSGSATFLPMSARAAAADA